MIATRSTNGNTRLPSSVATFPLNCKTSLMSSTHSDSANPTSPRRAVENPKSPRSSTTSSTNVAGSKRPSTPHSTSMAPNSTLPPTVSIVSRIASPSKSNGTTKTRSTIVISTTFDSFSTSVPSALVSSSPAAMSCRKSSNHSVAGSHMGPRPLTCPSFCLASKAAAVLGVLYWCSVFVLSVMMKVADHA